VLRVPDDYLLIAAIDTATLVVARWLDLSIIGTLAAIFSAHLAARMLIR
jgi:hypothetical protein